MTSPLFLLQMAGVPGSGKSALARLIGRSLDAAVIDKDVLKSAALEAGVENSLAGSSAYESMFELADHLLGQGWSVVLDSPSFWEQIPRKGLALASERHVPYHFIECYCPDRDELGRRLRERPRLPSNPGEEVLDEHRSSITPPGAYLRIDTTRPIERCLELALDYVGGDTERGDGANTEPTPDA